MINYNHCFRRTSVLMKTFIKSIFIYSPALRSLMNPGFHSCLIFNPTPSITNIQVTFRVLQTSSPWSSRLFFTLHSFLKDILDCPFVRHSFDVTPTWKSLRFVEDALCLHYLKVVLLHITSDSPPITLSHGSHYSSYYFSHKDSQHILFCDGQRPGDADPWLPLALLVSHTGSGIKSVSGQMVNKIDWFSYTRSSFLTSVIQGQVLINIDENSNFLCHVRLRTASTQTVISVTPVTLRYTIKLPFTDTRLYLRSI